MHFNDTDQFLDPCEDLGDWDDLQGSLATQPNSAIDKANAILQYVGIEDSPFAQNFRQLVCFFEKNGDFNVPKKSHARSGKWVESRCKKAYVPCCSQHACFFFVWSPRQEAWNQQFQELVAYRNTHGKATPLGSRKVPFIDH